MPEESTHSRSVTVAGGTIELSWAGVTHTGRRREINQDALLTQLPAVHRRRRHGRAHRRRDRQRQHRRPPRRRGRGRHGHAEDHREGALARGQGHRVPPRDHRRRHRHDADRRVSRPQRRPAAVGHAQHRRFARLPDARRDDRADHHRPLGRAGADRGRAAQPRRGREPPVRQRHHARRRPERERRPPTTSASMSSTAIGSSSARTGSRKSSPTTASSTSSSRTRTRPTRSPR